MKQVLQSYRTGELWLADVDPPVAAPLGARVRTRASLVSAGTERAAIALAKMSLVGKAQARPDLVRRVIDKARKEGVWSTWEQVWQKLDQPVALGYSCAGVVEDVRDADHLRPGARVACAGAGYASHSEINWIPRNLIVPLPENVSFEEGAFATVGAIALQAVRQSEPRLGDRIVVIGLGLLGNLAAQLARASGARVLGVDLSKLKADLGRQTGCHEVHWEGDLDARVAAFTGGHGADTVILAASTPGDSALMQQAVKLARLRGRIVVLGDVGMDIPRNEAYLKELDVRLSMSYGPGRYDATYEDRGQDYPYAHVRYTEQRNLSAFLEAVSDGSVRLGPLLTHRFPIDRALEAYDLIEHGREPHVGVVLTYGSVESTTPRVVAAATAAAPAPDRFERTPGRPGIAVLGAGNYLKGVLLPALKRADVDRVAVINRTGPSAEQTRAQAGFRWAGTDLERALRATDIHAVVIGTRHRLHASQVIACLEAGKHVFVEKPLALTEEELARVARAQRSAGRYVQVGTNRRHSPYTKALRDVFGYRGDPISVMIRVNAGRLDANHWLRDPIEGGGRLLGEGIHWFDLAHAIVGAPIQQVLAWPSPGGATALPGDTWTTNLRFRDGSVATITYDAEGPRTLEKERIEVIGVGKAAEILDWTAGKCWTTAGARALAAPRGQQKGVAEEIEVFLNAIRSGEAGVPLDTTWHVMHAALAARASFDDGAPRDVAWPRPADQEP